MIHDICMTKHLLYAACVIHYCAVWKTCMLRCCPLVNFKFQHQLLSAGRHDSFLIAVCRPPWFCPHCCLQADMILSYHPPIFRPLKRLTQASWKERCILGCIEHRIAVYAPHTILDCLQGGVTDWLIEPFGAIYANLYCWSRTVTV